MDLPTVYHTFGLNHVSQSSIRRTTVVFQPQLKQQTVQTDKTWLALFFFAPPLPYCHTLHGKVLYILFSFFIRKVNSNNVPTKLFSGVAGQVCDIIGRQLRTCFLHMHSLSFSILSLDRTVSGFISPTPQLPVGRTSQQQPLCVLFRCFLCYSGRLKFHFFRFMGSCWIPIFSKKLCFVFRLAYPKHLPEVKTCLAHGSQEVPEEDLDTTLPQPGHGFRGSVKTWRGWMRNVRNREHAGKAIAYHLYFNIFHNMIYIPVVPGQAGGGSFHPIKRT